MQERKLFYIVHVCKISRLEICYILSNPLLKRTCKHTFQRESFFLPKVASEVSQVQFNWIKQIWFITEIRKMLLSLIYFPRQCKAHLLGLVERNEMQVCHAAFAFLISRLARFSVGKSFYFLFISINLCFLSIKCFIELLKDNPVIVYKN